GDGTAPQRGLYCDRERARADLGLTHEAMSQDNVEIVREIDERMNRRDWAAILTTFDEEVVLVVHESVGPNAGIFRGREAVGRWFGDWFLAFCKYYRFEVEESRCVGDRVLIVARHHAHGCASVGLVVRV